MRMNDWWRNEQMNREQRKTRWREVIKLRGLGWTYKRIGDHYGVCSNQAREIFLQAKRCEKLGHLKEKT